MTKPNRLSAVANRSEHTRPTIPAPAFMACKAAALRVAVAEGRPATDLTATLPVDLTSQLALLAIRDSILDRRVTELEVDVELEVDRLFSSPEFEAL